MKWLRVASVLLAAPGLVLTAREAISQQGVTIPGAVSTQQLPSRVPLHSLTFLLHHGAADLLLTDPQGRRTGRDPTANVDYNEIPESGYGDTAIADVETGESVPPVMELDITEPVDGSYDLQVTGTATGSYRLSIRPRDRTGKSPSTTVFDNIPTAPPVNSPSTGAPGKHSVVAIGRDDPVNPTTWKVNDPDGGRVTTLSDKEIYKNKYYGLRIFQGPEKTITFGGITIRLYSPAELLVTDFQGRRTGFDPITTASFSEIPLASYGEDGLEDLTSDSPPATWKEFDVARPADGRYETAVTGTAFGTYKLLFLTEDQAGDEQGRETFRDVPTAPGVVHKYTLDYSATPGTPLKLSGGFDGHGQRPSDVNKFLTYANPSSARTQLPAGETTFALLIFYDKAIRPQTFKATINGADITALFTPTPGSHERVNLSLVSGSSNTLVLSVEGTTASGRVATDTDRLVILVP